MHCAPGAVARRSIHTHDSCVSRVSLFRVQLLEEVFASKRAKRGAAKEGGGGDEGESFLKQYISNRMWLGAEDDSDEGGNIVGLGNAGAKAADGSEDEEEVDKQEEFETNYNFRFEEPGGARRAAAVLLELRVFPGECLDQDRRLP